MFITNLVGTCSTCGNITDTICRIDEKLADYSTNLFHNMVFLSSKRASSRRIKDLIIYKFLLTKLMTNPKYLSPYSSKQIIAKVEKILV